MAADPPFNLFDESVVSRELIALRHGSNERLQQGQPVAVGQG